MHTQDNYHQTLSTQTFHGPTTQPHQDPSIFICMWLPLVQVIDWVFTWNQIYHLGWNKFLAWDFRWVVSLVWSMSWVHDLVNDVVGQNWLILLWLFFEVWFMCLVAKKVQKHLGKNSTSFFYLFDVNFFI